MRRQSRSFGAARVPQRRGAIRRDVARFGPQAFDLQGPPENGTANAKRAAWADRFWWWRPYYLWTGWRSVLHTFASRGFSPCWSICVGWLVGKAKRRARCRKGVLVRVT